MTKLTDKVKNKIKSKLQPLVEAVGKELYYQLCVVRNDMNIDIKDIIDSTDDYSSFWELVAKYYNDYVDTEEYENV